ncbi:MAG TPA: hypothetical protein VM779_07300 [Thermoanaerobaculia bacterium]|nr:hypothetical protein [Thermoanaerobaculia bacterium]
MIRRIAVSVLLLTLAAPASAEEIRGAWTADATDRKPGRIHLQMSRAHNNFGQTMDIASLSGLSEAQIRSATQVPVTFALRREAGTLAYRGTFEAGFGAGQFTFTPNESYLETVRALGVDISPRKTKHIGKPIDERLMQFAIQDVSTTYIRAMQAVGYRGSLDQYLEFRIFKVTPELVTELRSLGYRDVAADDLVASQIHRVTPQYIRELRDAGYTNIPVNKLIEMRIHGVDGIFVRKMNGM